MLKHFLTIAALFFVVGLSSCAVFIDNDDDPHEHDDEDSVTIIIH